MLGRCIVIQPRTNSVEKIIRVSIFATELFRASLEFHAKQRPKPSNICKHRFYFDVGRSRKVKEGVAV